MSLSSLLLWLRTLTR